jgi:hypothetical protein
VELGFLAEVVKGFDQLEPLAVLNASSLMHDILSRSGDGPNLLADYLRGPEVIGKMFDVLEFGEKR